MPAVEFNLQCLSKYIDTFNGRRIAFIASLGEDLPAVPFKKYGISLDEIAYVKNDPKLRETAHFITMLKKVVRNDGWVFYCHSKGVSRTKSKGVKVWTKYMYDQNLGVNLSDYDDKTVVGALRTTNTGPIMHNWHYSGTFFWLNLCKLRLHNWGQIRKTKLGVESWPGMVIPYEESACIGLDNFEGTNYSIQEWISRGIKTDI